MYFCTNFGWYFLMYFLPKQMQQSFGINKDSSTGYQLGVALLTGAPFFLGGIACIWGGVLSDRFIRRTGNLALGRKLFGMLGYAGSCLAYIIAIFNFDSPYILIACLAMVGFFSDLTLGPAWATAQDIGKRYAAIVSGCMNMIGNLGGALSNYLTGVIIASYTNHATKDVDSTGYIICMTMYAISYAVGVVFWYLTDANKPLAED